MGEFGFHGVYNVKRLHLHKVLGGRHSRYIQLERFGRKTQVAHLLWEVNAPRMSARAPGCSSFLCKGAGVDGPPQGPLSPLPHSSHTVSFCSQTLHSSLPWGLCTCCSGMTFPGSVDLSGVTPIALSLTHFI